MRALQIPPAAVVVWIGAAQAQTKPPPELQKAIEEFRIQTGLQGLRDTPEAGATTAAIKPRWHGRLFENFRNDFLDALPHEVAQRGGTKSILRRHQFGLNVTGPVVIPKPYERAP